MAAGWSLIFWAFLLDVALGDPRWLPHPVVGIGKTIAALENLCWRILSRIFRGSRTRPGGSEPWRTAPAWAQRTAGALLVAAVVGGTYAAVWALLRFADLLGAADWLTRGSGGALIQILAPGLFFGCGVNGTAWPAQALAVWLIYTSLATRSLSQHARAVYEALRADNLPEARRAAARMVGRDTDQLDRREICRAGVESVAESACDGIIAPLFYAFLGGAPLALAYKAVNTLDSMIGYRNSRYEYLGWAAARLDDAANWVPARLAALALAVAGLLGPVKVQEAAVGRAGSRWRIWRNTWRLVRRDARRHPSPNGGFPETVVAALLGVRLGGWNFYGGVASFRAYMGDPRQCLEPGHVQAAMALVWRSAWLVLAAGLVATGLAVAGLAAPVRMGLPARPATVSTATVSTAAGAGARAALAWAAGAVLLALAVQRVSQGRPSEGRLSETRASGPAPPVPLPPAALPAAPAVRPAAGAPGAGPVKRTPAQWAVSQWRSFSLAASFLTALPFHGSQEQAPDFAVSRAYFPLVGLLAGLGMAAADAAVGGLGLRWHAAAHAAGAAAALLASAWITGGLHLDGFADTLDGLYARRGRERALEIMRDSRLGSMGAAFLMLVLLLQFTGIAALDWPRRLSLLVLMPVAGRLAMTWVIPLYPYARTGPGLGQLFSNPGPPGPAGRWPRQVAGPTAWTLAILAAAVGLQATFGAAAAPAASQTAGAGMLALAVSQGAALVFARRVAAFLGGMTGDTYGAVCVVAETAYVLAADIASAWL